MQKRSALVLPATVVVLASLLILNTAVPSKAASMNTILSPNANEAVVKYESLQVLNIKYPSGSNIGSKLIGQNVVIEFTVDSSDPGIQMLMKDMNAYLLRERGSTVTVSDLVIHYKGVLAGLKDSAALTHKVGVEMTIAGYVIGPVKEGEDGKLVDLNWRTFIMDQRVEVQTEKWGMIEINRPSGFILATIPSLMESLSYDRTLELLNKPALDFSQFAIPVDEWKWQVDSNEQITVVTTQGGLGVDPKPARYNVSFNDDQGKPHELSLTIPPPSGTIQILGFAKAYAIGPNEGGAIVYEYPIPPPTNPFALQLLLVMGGLMGAIAIVVLLKARK
jgi:hypothetical protein